VAGLVRRRWLLVLLSIVACVGFAVGYLMITPPTYEAGASLLVEDREYDLPDVMKRISNVSDVNTQLEVLRSAGLAELVTRELALRVNTTAYSGPGAGWADTRIGRILPSIPQPVPRSRLLSAVAVADSADTTTVTLTRIATGDFRATDGLSGKTLDTVVVGKPATLGGVSFTLAPGAADFSKIDLQVGTLTGAVGALRENVRIARADRDVDVIWIRYRTSDPLLASQVPDLWAGHYLESKTSNAKAKIATAVGFLRGQADTIQGQLTAAEMALRDYRQNQGIVDLPSEAMSSVSQGAEVGTKRMLMESERTALKSLVADADKDNGTGGGSPYRRLAGFPTLINNPVVSGHLHTLSDLEDQRAQLMERRTAQDPDVVALDRRIGDVDAALRGLTNTYLAGLNNQLGSLDQSLATQRARGARIPTQSMDEERLSRKPKLLSDVYAMIQTRLQEARIAENAADPGVRMIDRAEVPTIPVWPRANLILLVAGVVGVMVGGAFAWLREGLDGSVHSRADVIRASGVPLLGLIPRIRMLRKNRRPMPELLTGSPQGFGSRARRRRTEQSHKALLMGGQDKSGAAMEAYAWLETSLALTRPNDAPRTVAFTSPLAREGKTINASNLALSVARKGKRVLLIDGDLRRGMIHQLFGIAQDRGLAEVLAGRVKLEQAIRVLPLGQGSEIHVMPSGQTEGPPSSAMRPDALRDLLARLRDSYDLILIDSPPVNLVSDPLVVASMVDGVILVARAGVTDADALAQASQHLREAGAPVLGVLLNDIDTKRDSSYDDSYRYLDEAGAYGTVVPA
jgi:capsular exopolysaccharide synthesis family protein